MRPNAPPPNPANPANPDNHVPRSQGLALPAPAPTQSAGRRTLAWPAPALLAWIAAWALQHGLSDWGLSPALAKGVAIGAVGAVALLPGLGRPWRRVTLALGYPLALLASGAAAEWPAWCWLLPLALLLLAYPVRAWRDAPLFPTPLDALHGLAALAPLGDGARILDAGCGLGHGLLALRREWPAASIEGIEWSWPLRLLAGARCRFARVCRGDMWRADWSGCALVYLFQRPESMARALAKARTEMTGGGWLVSLAFAVPDTPPHAVLHRPGGHSVWLYAVSPGPQPGPGAADKPGNTLALRR